MMNGHMAKYNMEDLIQTKLVKIMIIRKNEKSQGF